LESSPTVRSKDHCRQQARKKKLQKAETIKNRENLKIREIFMKHSCRRKKQLKIREFFKEILSIRENSNFLLQEKDLQKQQRTS
jgi:hypothetical protein